MDLSGRVALVTGASRGIGAAIAKRLAEAGADVAVGYANDRTAAEEQTARISGMGRRAVAVGSDVSDPAGLEEMVGIVEVELGSVDILISNAGIAPQQSLEEITIEDWDRTMNVNLRPAFLLAKRLAPGMRGRKWGRMVFISSVAAFTGGIVGPHYTTSKAGLIGLARALAGPLAPHGVTVNAVAPALIEGGETLPGDEESRRQFAERVPVGRLGSTEEVAEAVLSLVFNPFITAQTISVDGGMHPR
ncbi:MAG TPA: 3-oxoacyl-ACP reductase family protein [Rubrobacter sp.]|jgi:3-oxoacyl-[acyl-carrier protein] reductase